MATIIKILIQKTIFKETTLVVRFLLLLFSSSFFSISGKEAIPLHFTSEKIPYCEGSIDGCTYHIWIDLGRAVSQFDQEKVPEKALSPLYKKFRLVNFEGKKEILQGYTIHHLRLGSFLFSPIDVAPHAGEGVIYTFSEDTSTHRSQSPYPSIILGNPVFENQVVLFDFPSHSLTLFDSGESYASIVKDWIETDITPGAGVWTIDATIEKERRTFCLDTASSHNFLFSDNDEELLSQPLCIQKTSLDHLLLAQEPLAVGPFFRINRSDSDVDGLLGAPFFSTRPILIDFPQRKMHFPLD